MATDKGGGDEQDWLFDYVMSVLKAPTWEVPIMTFIDDNCIVFDSEEENKFAYTELHEVLIAIAGCTPGSAGTPCPRIAHPAPFAVVGSLLACRSNSARWWSLCLNAT